MTERIFDPVQKLQAQALLPKEALAEVQKIVSDARQEHYFMTQPWDDNGYRVFPSAASMDHTEKMRDLANRFNPSVDALAREFGNLVEQAKVRLGGLFWPEDYPVVRTTAPCDLASKYYCKYIKEMLHGEERTGERV